MIEKKYKGNTTPKEIVEKIKISKNILITAHINPDGDALGSILAFYYMIEQYNEKYIENEKNYIKCDIVIDDKLPRYMRHFVEENSLIKRIENITNDKEYDLFISLDCANAERYGQSIILKNRAKESINIDHHISNTEHADYNYVEDICSTSELVYQFLDLFGIKLSKKIADFMYLGIINDTGNFRHDNVTANTFFVCSEIMKAGTNNHKIANIIFEISEKKVDIVGEVYKNKITNNEFKFRYYYLSKEKIEQYGIDKDDTNGIAEMLLKIEDTELSLFIRDDEKGGIKGSFRANDKYDVNKMATIFGGGGHVKAAGFRTENISAEKIIDKVLMYLKELKE